MDHDLYAVIGVGSDAPQQAIESAFHEKHAALTKLTELGDADVASFLRVLNAAYVILGDPAKRTAYDEMRRHEIKQPRETKTDQETAAIAVKETSAPNFGSLPKEVSVYQTNVWVYYNVLLVALGLAACKLVYSAEFGNEKEVDHFIMLAAFVSGVCGFGVAVWNTRRSLPYTAWANDSKPYISFDHASINLLGEVQIPWSSVAFVSQFLTPGVRSLRSYLLLGFTQESPACRAFVANHPQFTRLNGPIAYRFDLEEASFLTLPLDLDGLNRLSLPGDRIVGLVERYRIAAGGTISRIPKLLHPFSDGRPREPKAPDGPLMWVLRILAWLVVITFLVGTFYGPFQTTATRLFFENLESYKEMQSLVVVGILVYCIASVLILGLLGVIRNPWNVPGSPLARVFKYSGAIVITTIAVQVPFFVHFGQTRDVLMYLNNKYGVQSTDTYVVRQKQATNYNCNRLDLEGDRLVAPMFVCVSQVDFDRVKIGDTVRLGVIRSKYGVRIVDSAAL